VHKQRGGKRLLLQGSSEDGGTGVAEAQALCEKNIVPINDPYPEAAMSDRGIPASTWVIVTLAAAVIGSPLIIRGGEQRGALPPEQQQATPPIKVELTLPEALQPRPQPVAAPQPTQTSAPVVRSMRPAPSVSVLDTRGRYLQAADLAGLSRWELDILRNEIYARHGRRFNRAELQAHFDQQSWYRPRYAPDAFPEHVLNAMERWNAELIADYQRTR
jgi:hypothetical protein